MKWQPLIATILVASFPYAAGAQSPPPVPTIATWIPCDGPGGTGHQVTVFSEGTAWNRGGKAAWLTVYNPEDSAQDVWVHLYVDGATTPVGLYTSLQGHSRFAWHINAQLLNLDPTSINRNSNFATEVFFGRQGVATLALWELGDSHGYLRSSYLEGTERCVMWTP